MDRSFMRLSKRPLEEQYFLKREQELIEKLRRRMEEEARRQDLSERTGLVDQEILKDLLSLGYTSDTVMLLHLVPLVQVAWADGFVSDGERQLIIDAARSRGIEEGSPARRQLDEWLARRPSDAVFEKTIRAVVAMLEARPAPEREITQRDLLFFCAEVAEVCGGILGFGRVSTDERRVLMRLTTELEGGHPTAVERTIALLEGR